MVYHCVVNKPTEVGPKTISNTLYRISVSIHNSYIKVTKVTLQRGIFDDLKRSRLLAGVVEFLLKTCI